MTLDDVMKALAAKGSESTKRIWLKHGAKEPFFGVKIADLKVIQKNIKGDQGLAMKLYATGNGDAQYLAGMVADGATMTPAQLNAWAKGASWSMISGFPVSWVTSENSKGVDLATKWIESPNELMAVAGWRTLGALVTIRADDDLPVKELGRLLDRVSTTQEKMPDDVRLAMNQFIIACGTYSPALAEKAISTARRVGNVEADMGDTACKIPDAESYIMKSRRGSPIAPKRKTVRC